MVGQTDPRQGHQEFPHSQQLSSKDENRFGVREAKLRQGQRSKAIGE